MPIGHPETENRPDLGAASPMDVVMIKLLGGTRHGSVTVTNQQLKFLEKAYGFDPEYAGRQADTIEKGMIKSHAQALVEFEEGVRKYEEWMATPQDEREYPCPKDPRGWDKKEPPEPPSFDRESIIRLHDAGSIVNLFRHVEHDGVRMVAYLAQYLEPGQDPVQLLEELCIEAGYDCMRSEWPGENEEEDEEL